MSLPQGGYPWPPRLGYIPCFFMSPRNWGKWQLGSDFALSGRPWCCWELAWHSQSGYGVRLPDMNNFTSIPNRATVWPRWIRRKTGPVCKSVTLVGHLTEHEYCPNTKVPNTLGETWMTLGFFTCFPGPSLKSPNTSLNPIVRPLLRHSMALHLCISLIEMRSQPTVCISGDLWLEVINTNLDSSFCYSHDLVVINDRKVLLCH